MKNTNDTDQALLAHVSRALAANRHPGLHFPGFYLGLHSRGISKAAARLAMPYGPHCADADGKINIAAIATLADMGLSAAMRPHTGEGLRIATLTMHLQFTGAAARSELRSEAQFDGFFSGASALQGRSSGKLYAGDELICHSSGSFANPSVPAGVKIYPVPWDAVPWAKSGTPLPAMRMDDKERAVITRAKAALKARSQDRSFIEQFWAQIARPLKNGGAGNTVKLGAHNGNRVGHVQGGVLFGVAASTATAALARESVLTSASAWYISAGMGDRLHVRSSVLQQGRTVGVVLTRVTDRNGRLVLEMVTGHAFHPKHDRVK